MTGQVTSERERLERIFFNFCVQAQKELPDHLSKRSKKVIVIAGPTAVGKTELSLQLAKAVDGEVVSGDSMQVYRGMDIGTAKATFEERQQVPHHLIDVWDVPEQKTVHDFYVEARRAFHEILDRKATPIVVGGSGFYLHTLIYGPPNTPKPVPEVRQALEKEMKRLGPEKMYRHLRHLDPEYAATITEHDKQKIIRALEIITLTGARVSRLPWSERKTPQEFDFLCWFIHRPRDLLYQRIEDRCDMMLEAGLQGEVEQLLNQGLLKNRSAAQAIGYKQMIQYLNSPRTEADWGKMVVDFKRASRQYAKRQFTWFRKEPLFRWIDVDRHDPELALDMMVRDYESRL